MQVQSLRMESESLPDRVFIATMVGVCSLILFDVEAKCSLLSWFTVVAMSIIFAGCEMAESPRTHLTCEQLLAVRQLEEMAQHDSGNAHLHLALSKLESGVQDSKPVLIRATMDGVLLELCVFDDGKDLVGFRIREEYKDTGGAMRILEEDYPVFLDRRLYPVQDLVGFYIYVPWTRNPGEPRDEEGWRTYIEAISSAGVYIQASKVKRPVMPAIGMARPLAGNVRVWISVYDAKGNESALELPEYRTLEEYRREHLSEGE